MKRIDELQLFNFKFFTDSDNLLKFGNRNLLIWGENGSGKSSIYWSIYTILQCSFKDDAGVNAYFTEGGAKNLININAPTGSDSYIRMKLDDGNEYFIALDGRKNVQGVTDIQLSAVSSDFIDYNVVASFMRAYHRDDLFLFEMFEEEIFRYVKFTSPTTTPIDFFDNAWAEIQKGLVKDSTTKKYPSPGSTVYDQYKALVDAFNLQLRTLLGLVTVKANEILKNKFGYDIEIELPYKKVDFELSRNYRSISYEQPEIELRIKKYLGKENVVKKPHSFLNEAKMYWHLTTCL